jgi:5-dehydro-2-deoxygluconokinase
MSHKNKEFDALFMGRSSIDLYSNDIGAPFEEITSFGAFVGGSPTNMSVGLSRLGGKAALLTGLGEDPVGDFILRFLRQEKVFVDAIPRKADRRTSAVVLGIEPPDRFPLVYYRENCADIALSIDDVLAAPFDDCTVFEFAGTNLSLEPSRSATFLAAELARAAGAITILDVDFRPDQWHDTRAFGVMARAVLPYVDVVIATEDELNAAVLKQAGDVSLTASQISDAKVAGDSAEAVARMLAAGPAVVIEKTGREGARVHARPDARRRLETGRDGPTAVDSSVFELKDAPVDVAGFPVEVQNILGAGDAFGAGFVSGLTSGRSLPEAVSLGNACGAIVVTRPACANSMPSLAEVEEFMKGYEQGGAE